MQSWCLLLELAFWSPLRVVLGSQLVFESQAFFARVCEAIASTKWLRHCVLQGPAKRLSPAHDGAMALHAGRNPRCSSISTLTAWQTCQGRCHTTCHETASCAVKLSLSWAKLTRLRRMHRSEQLPKLPFKGFLLQPALLAALGLL